MDENMITLFIDLSKVFDTINHEILLSELFHFGIRGLPFEWFKSYFSNRKQQTNFCGKISFTKFIKDSVTQESILDPLLFLVYINNLPNSLIIHAYAVYCKLTIPPFLSSSKTFKKLFKILNRN